MEQSLAFWREEFTKIMDHEKFDKNYAYNIRHSYGKEGKRTNYTPYSCMKIITTNQPSVGDHHGCPFRHWDDSHIRQMLAGHGLSAKSIQSIETYYQKGHYQLSCQKYFEITHGLNVAKFSLEHPTQYFIESRQARGAGVGEPPPDRSKEENTIESMMDDEM
jgi:DNA primase large subunit